MNRATMKVWVVEMWNEEKQRWEACADCGLTREDAEASIMYWKERNPDARFRVARYEMVEKKRRTK